MAASVPTVCIKGDYISRQLTDEEHGFIDEYMQQLLESNTPLHIKEKGGRARAEEVTFGEAWASVEGTRYIVRY
jgi:hypothetical protein